MTTKKRICWIVDFATPADHRVKLKESEKKDKYLDLARQFKKLWNIKVTIGPIVIGALRIVFKGLVQVLEDMEIRWHVETIQTTALLRSVGILRRVQETWGYSKSIKKPFAHTGVKNLQRSTTTTTNNNNNNNNNNNKKKKKKKKVYVMWLQIWNG